MYLGRDKLDNLSMTDNNELYTLVSNLLQLPKHILRNAHAEDLPALILKKLASKKYFTLNKAAYFLDNPEFNVLKGIAGYDVNEDDDCDEVESLDDLQTKSIKFLSGDFHTSVKNARMNSFYANHKNEADIKTALTEFAQKTLATENPIIYQWHSKHGNHGLFFCDPKEHSLVTNRSHLLEFATNLLGMSHF